MRSFLLHISLGVQGAARRMRVASAGEVDGPRVGMGLEIGSSPQVLAHDVAVVGHVSCRLRSRCPHQPLTPPAGSALLAALLALSAACAPLIISLVEVCWDGVGLASVALACLPVLLTCLLVCMPACRLPAAVCSVCPVARLFACLLLCACFLSFSHLFSFPPFWFSFRWLSLSSSCFIASELRLLQAA